MAENIAAENGNTLDRKNWRLVFPAHLAESREEALADIREGCNRWIHEYFIDTLGAQIQFQEYPNQPIAEMTADRMAARGGVIVGTPDDAVKRIEEAIEASGRGGFGGLLVLAHEWASREKTLRSYELMARYVMPRFQGAVEPIGYSQHWTAERKEGLFNSSVTAIMKSMQDYREHEEKAGRRPSELATGPVTRVRP
jgi:limonene 1,2-monooxygenase